MATAEPSLFTMVGGPEGPGKQPGHSDMGVIAFSSEVDTGSREQNASGPKALARRQNHDDLASLELSVLLDFREFGDVGLHLVQELGADFLVRHFAAAVAQGDLDLVAFLKEALHRPHLHVVIVIIDHRPQLDLLDLDDLLLLAGFGGFLLRGIFILPVIHNLADGRIGIRRNLNKIHARFEGHLDRNHRFDGALVGTILIDQLDLRVTDFIIGARPIFGRDGRGSIGTANG